MVPGRLIIRIDDQFANYYNGIHDANFYLENLTGLKFETWENTNDYDNWMITYPNFEYEVRFLRAYFYFDWSDVIKMYL